MKLSIITINYNNLEGLKRTYESVVSQTCQDFEWIIIDGGSTDGSKEFIEEHQDKFAYWCSEPDKGVYNAMNKGVRKAHGSYVQFINSGDELYDKFVIDNIEKCQFNADIVVGDNWLVSSDGEVSYNPQPGKIAFDDLYFGSISHPSSYIKIELLLMNPYREDLEIVSDWEFFLKQIIFTGKSYQHIPYSISKFYKDGISQNKDDINRERQLVINEYFSNVLNEVIFGGSPLYKCLRKEPQNSFLYRVLWFIYKILITIRRVLGHAK